MVTTHCLVLDVMSYGLVVEVFPGASKNCCSGSYESWDLDSCAVLIIKVNTERAASVMDRLFVGIVFEDCGWLKLF